MNVCDTSFERAKTAVLHGGDVLDCISVLMEKIRHKFLEIKLKDRSDFLHRHEVQLSSLSRTTYHTRS